MCSDGNVYSNTSPLKNSRSSIFGALHIPALHTPDTINQLTGILTAPKTNTLLLTTCISDLNIPFHYFPVGSALGGGVKLEPTAAYLEWVNKCLDIYTCGDEKG